VPELDLFLDGTAEFSGTTEFPQMDQGVTVLVVGPNGAELRQSPVMPPEHNTRQRTLTVDLHADGSAALEIDETVRGHEAPSWRSQYQAPGTRLDRFERAMRNTFNGIEVERVEMEGLTDYEAPVHAHYRAAVPQFATRDADGLRVPVSVMGDLVRSLARTEGRTQAFDLGHALRRRPHAARSRGDGGRHLAGGRTRREPLWRLLDDGHTRGPQRLDSHGVDLVARSRGSRGLPAI
jgi:hypothetical protein